MPNTIAQPSEVLAVMPDGIGDLSFASEGWVKAAAEVLGNAVARYAQGLSDLGKFTLCEVGHNPPVHLKSGSKLAWFARFDGANVEVSSGELPAEECDFKMQGDHSIISNLARIRYHGNDPELVALAQARLNKLSKWKIDGKMPEHKVLQAVLNSLHDMMSERTMPRFVFMTPEWVSSARYLLSTRAASDKYAEGISDLVYTFSEEFINTPRYAFPDGSHGGFWVKCNRGQITVGAGPLPKELEPADALTKGDYTPVVPVGRTVNASLTEEDQAELAAYSKTAFRYDKIAKKATVDKSSPSGRGDMPAELARIFMPLHDELSKRTSGELPLDFDPSIKPEWSSPQRFDRDENYDTSWLRYDRVDIYGNPLA